MKIKNFKIDLKKALKMTKYVLVGSFLTVGLTGCGSEEKDALLEGTLLEDAIVLTFDDGSKDVAVVKGKCYDDDNYEHYRSVITNEYYASNLCLDEVEATVGKNKILNKYEIVNQEKITKYLTKEELKSAANDELDTDDIIAIIDRTVNTSTETNSKTK